MLPNLSDLLNYKNPKLIARYQKDYPENKIPAEEALTEILKYFWLCEKHREDLKNDPDNEELKFDCSVHFEMAEIDDMWHTFLLFTIDYAEFCKKYFDHFIHHVPTTEETKKPSKKEFKKSLTRMLSYVYDNLGEETLKKWFSEYFTVDES